MQKIRFYVCAIAFFVGTFSPSIAGASSPVDNLLSAISASVDEDYIQVDAEGVLSFGETKLTLENVFQKDHAKSKTKNAFEVDFYAKSLPEKAFENNDLLTKDLEISLDGVATIYLNKDTGDIFYDLADYKIEVDSDNDDLQNILEGFFEITKIFTGETYYVNFETLAKDFENFEDLYEEFKALNLEAANSEDLILLLEAFLKSGLFEITEDDDVFTITLKNQVTAIDSASMEAAISQVSFLSESDKITLIQELKKVSTASTNTHLNELKKYLDFSIKIEKSGSLIGNVKINATVDLTELAQASGEDIILNSLNYTQNIDLDYANTKVNLPSKASSQISLNKIIGLFLTLEKQWQSQWENSADSDYNYDSDSDYDYEDDLTIPETQVQETSDEVVSFDTNAWYAPFVQNLIDKNIIYYVDNPAQKLTKSEFKELLDSVSNYCYYSLDQSLDLTAEARVKLSSSEKISKLDALTYIVNTFFPEEKYPVAFAMKNGIVSTGFNTSEARVKKATIVEIAKMLSVSIDLLENQ